MRWFGLGVRLRDWGCLARGRFSALAGKTRMLCCEMGPFLRRCVVDGTNWRYVELKLRDGKGWEKMRRECDRTASPSAMGPKQCHYCHFITASTIYAFYPFYNLP